MHLSRERAGIVAPRVWIVILLLLGLFARPLLIPGGAISTFVLDIYYAARDASGHE